MVKICKQRGVAKHALTTFVLFSLLIIVLSSCNGTQSGNNSSPDNKANGKGCTKIGVLLPDSAYSARWDSNDRPDLINDIEKYLPC
jgi:D-xylose transport system substrate-binding protein